MKKPVWPFALLYYVLVLCIYLATLDLTAFFLHLWKLRSPVDSFLVACILLFFFLPVLTGVLMRFSLLKWCVDPFAAAELPLVLYGVLLRFEMKRTNDFFAAVRAVASTLGNGDGSDWILLVGMFLFGLVFSLSFARTRGESVSYRLLSNHIK